MGSSSVVGFTWQEDAGFINGLWVHSSTPWVSLGSSGDVGFTRVRPGGSWAYPGSLCSLRFALPVHPVSLRSLVYAVGVVGYIQSR